MTERFFFVVAIVMLLSTNAPRAEVGARIKYTGIGIEQHQSDLVYPFTGSQRFDQSLDLRFQLSADIAPFSFQLDTTSTWLHGDQIRIENALNIPLERRLGNDSTRAKDLYRRIYESDVSTFVIGIDRAVLQYRSKNWAVKVGRDAVTWGNGFAFHPLDFLSPYSPTAVDREFKTSSDLFLVEKLFANGSDLQALYIARSDDYLMEDSRSTSAFKYKGFTDRFEYELVLGQHFDDRVIAGTLQIPLGGALLRTDLVSTCTTQKCYRSRVLNVDYTFAVRGNPLYTFIEYYHNGFGVDELPPNLEGLPSQLVSRQQRGELFTLQKDYVVVGSQVIWHPLWSQNVVVIRNIQDSGTLFQTFLGYDPSDNTRMQFGLIVPLADSGDEFGRITIGDGFTVGGGKSLFLSFAYYL